MYTHKDIETKTIFVINCLQERTLRVSNGELLLEEEVEEKKKILTKLPFQKILALFVVGHIKVTTPLIEKCQRFNVALVVMKPNLRPVFYWSNAAEANFLLRQKQYNFQKTDLDFAKKLVENKIANQMRALEKTRKKDSMTIRAKLECGAALSMINEFEDYNKLMGIEGFVSKSYFAAYFQDQDWKGRCPRIKRDVINVALDIGYTILFNFIECFARMFGFDLYVGVYHRMWFKRKSLICDLMEPFRCLIDHCVLLAFNRKQFSAKDFTLVKQEYRLKYDKTADYYRIYYDALIVRKVDIFKYVHAYYRCFMKHDVTDAFPEFVM